MDRIFHFYLVNLENLNKIMVQTIAEVVAWETQDANRSMIKWKT